MTPSRSDKYDVPSERVRRGCDLVSVETRSAASQVEEFPSLIFGLLNKDLLGNPYQQPPRNICQSRPGSVQFPTFRVCNQDLIFSSHAMNRHQTSVTFETETGFPRQ